MSKIKIKTPLKGAPLRGVSCGSAGSAESLVDKNNPQGCDKNSPEGCEVQCIKGTLYVHPNGDQFFEAAENTPKSISRKNGYKLIYSNGTTKHYTTRRRHVFFTSLSIDMVDLVGAVLPREIVRFCAEASVKKIKYYTKDTK